MHVNKAIIENNFKPEVVNLDSDNSEHESPPLAKQIQSPEDKFDMLIGRKKDNNEKQTYANEQSDSGDMFEKSTKTKQTKRKKIEQTTETDSDDIFATKISKQNTSSDVDSDKETKTKPKAKAKAAPARKRAPKTKKGSDGADTSPKSTKSRKKKMSTSSDDDDDDDFSDSKVKKTKSKKKKAFASSDEEFNLSADNHINVVEPKPKRAGRGAAKTKYVFDDSDESD